MDGDTVIVERTEQSVVTEEVPVVQPEEPVPEPAEIAAAEVVAAQGAVAVAAEAVSLADQTAAAAELQAAETIAEHERSFRTRVEEVLTWQGATVEALATLQQQQALMREALLSIQSRLTAAETRDQSLSTETVPIVAPDLESVVEENREAAAPKRRRHNWI